VFQIFLEGRRRPMVADMECPICDADIPMNGDERPGDYVLCSFCKVTFKLIRKKDNWALVEDYEV
jgi:hypothetical protein